MALDRTEIADQLREDIASGKYRAGDELPPYRHLASRLGAAPNTVGEAMRLLAAEGLVTSREKKPAVVRGGDEVAVSSEHREAVTRNELTQVQAELREIRTRINALDRRLSDLLSEPDA